MTITEQDVRTRAAWVGVEIGRSRVRTPGKPGYGLYRVRGSERFEVRTPSGVHHDYRPGGWTGYLFTLEMISICIDDAILYATPDRPGSLHLRALRAYDTGWSDPPAAVVPTRWTSRYRGPRGPLPAEPRSTVGTRRREANGQFQAAHVARREAGLRARHETKLRRGR